MNISRQVKEWAVALIVPLMLMAAWWSVSEVNAQNDRSRLAVVCQIERQNISQLMALKQISQELGLPGAFVVPERSAECVDMDGE